MFIRGAKGWFGMQRLTDESSLMFDEKAVNQRCVSELFVARNQQDKLRKEEQEIYDIRWLWIERKKRSGTLYTMYLCSIISPALLVTDLFLSLDFQKHFGVDSRPPFLSSRTRIFTSNFNRSFEMQDTDPPSSSSSWLTYPHFTHVMWWSFFPAASLPSFENIKRSAELLKLKRVMSQTDSQKVCDDFAPLNLATNWRVIHFNWINLFLGLKMIENS